MLLPSYSCRVVSPDLRSADRNQSDRVEFRLEPVRVVSSWLE